MGLDSCLLSRTNGTELGFAYWRKANAIHNFFVEVVQNGVDDCDDYPVTEDHLIQLRDACKDVLANPQSANTVLPTLPGFFFGSTEYDARYYDVATYTVDAVEKCLEYLRTNKGAEVFYSSSW